MSEEAKPACVGRDTACVLDNRCCALMNRVPQFARAVMPMHGLTELSRRAKIPFTCGSNSVSLGHSPDRSTLPHRERLARIETQLRIQRKRAVVKRRLYQPYSRK